MKRSNRAVELERLIRKYQDAYYNGEAEVSDATFDALWDELRLLEPDNELFLLVPKDADAGFAKAAHIIPMGSQEKASNPEAFREWARKQGFRHFIVQYKLDGASLELQYRQGVFVRAVTRGDGKVGDDITANVKRMKGVPLTLADTHFSGGVRGEVLMFKAVHRAHFADKANCRNAANGLMKRKDGIGCEHLQVICYDAASGTAGEPFVGYTPFSCEDEKIAWLGAQGFELTPTKKCDGVEAVIAYREEIAEKRDEIPFIIDGLVIKQQEIDTDDLRRARPEKQIAFKFSLDRATSVLREVEWSESGSTYTPVAIIDEVSLAGTKVRRASLANPNLISAMGLMIGSKVEVTKRGEIIPKIESLIENPDDASEIVFPMICAECNSTLVNEGSRLYCPNEECPKRLFHRLQKWISVLDIRDCGPALLRQLFDGNFVREIADLYTLNHDTIKNLERMGEKSAQNIINAIQAKKAFPLDKCIAGFDIDGIGEVMVQKLLADGFDRIEKMFAATEADFAAVYEFGDVLAQTLVRQLQVLKPQILRLLAIDGVEIVLAPKNEGHLEGRSFCFTGSLDTMKRSEAEALVKNAGGTAKSSVSKGLSFLVTNTPTSGSSKNKKAQSLNIPIITEAEFLELLNQQV